MKNQPSFTPLRVMLRHFLAAILDSLLPLLPAKLASNSLSSVSWNG